MSEKKEKILNAALELFTKEGFNNTSTSKVANHAGVSEGLIFRHFKNKDGLLQAIIEEGETRAVELFTSILSEQDPKEVLRKTIQLVLEVTKSPEEASFWKLQYKIKWEVEKYNKEKKEVIEQKLTEAFTELRYKNPQGEAQLMMIQIDGIAARIFLQKDFDAEEIVQFLLNKYGL